MFKKFKKVEHLFKDKQVFLLVVASLIVFLSFSMIYLFQKLSADYINVVRYNEEKNADQYYWEDSEEIKDPFITRNPDFDRLLAGPIISNDDPSMGDREAKVKIVYYSDFTCEYCQKQEQILKKMIQNYKYKVRLIWKDYPKNNKNSMSYRSAVAARCAQMQDNFWAYHDFLYEFADNLTEDTYLEIADILELDKDNFEECLNGEEAQKLVNKNIEEADALDITGIPFMYINKQEILGELDFDTLEQMIEHELSK